MPKLSKAKQKLLQECRPHTQHLVEALYKEKLAPIARATEELEQAAELEEVNQVKALAWAKRRYSKEKLQKQGVLLVGEITHKIDIKNIVSLEHEKQQVIVLEVLSKMGTVYSPEVVCRYVFVPTNLGVWAECWSIAHAGRRQALDKKVHEFKELKSWTRKVLRATNPLWHPGWSKRLEITEERIKSACEQAVLQALNDEGAKTYYVPPQAEKHHRKCVDVLKALNLV